MPSSPGNDDQNIDLQQDKRITRTRKHTPMIMPSRHVSHSSISIESIPEDENSCEEEDLPADNRVQLQVVGDGTFELPKLNKVEVSQKPTFKSKAIEVNLRHHTFESTPLHTADEQTSRVKLGKPVFDGLNLKSRRKKSSKSEFLALIKEEGFKVELDVPCSMSNDHMSLICFHQCYVFNFIVEQGHCMLENSGECMFDRQKHIENLYNRCPPKINSNYFKSHITIKIKVFTRGTHEISCMDFCGNL